MSQCEKLYKAGNGFECLFLLFNILEITIIDILNDHETLFLMRNFI